MKITEAYYNEFCNPASGYITKENCIRMTKLYAEECIKECAERARIKHVSPTMTNMDGVAIDKQSILSLIKELK